MCLSHSLTGAAVMTGAKPVLTSQRHNISQKEYDFTIQPLRGLNLIE